MSTAEILFSWDLIAAMNRVWEAHRQSLAMFSDDEFTDREIAIIATRPEQLAIHGSNRVAKEWNEIISTVGEDAAINRLVRFSVIG